MPRKKANQAYITDPTKTQYKSFVDDVANLTDSINALNLGNKIPAIVEQLKQKRDQIGAHEIQDNENLQAEGNQLAFQTQMLNQLIDQLEKLKDYAKKVTDLTTGQNNTLDRLINWKVTDPTAQNHKETDQDYADCTKRLTEIVSGSVAFFCGGNETGIPKNISRFLDNYNLSDGYREFVADNSVMAEVDKLLTDVSKLYTRSMKIASKMKRYKKTSQLEVALDYEKKNMEAFGKKCLNDQNYSLTSVRETFNNAETEYTEAKKAEQTAEKEYRNAEKRYLDAQKNQSQLIGQERSEIDAAKNAEDDYILKQNALKEAKLRKEEAEKLEKEAKALLEKNVKQAKRTAEKNAKDRARNKYEQYKQNLKKEAEAKKAQAVNSVLAIKNALDQMTIPDLTELNKAKGKKYSGYEDYLAPDANQIEKLAEAESQSKSLIEDLNHKIKKAYKNATDNKLQTYVDNEGTMSRYLKFPEFGRAVRNAFSKLPKKYQIDCSTYNVMQINAEIERRIESKIGPIGVWDPIKGMLHHLNNFCPNEYRTLPLSEETLSKCEAEGKEKTESFYNNDQHKLLKQYKDLKDAKTRLTFEKNSTKDKTRLKTIKTELEQIEKDIKNIKKNELYVEGASTVDEWIQESLSNTEVVFEFNKHQADIYGAALKKASDNEDAYNKGVFQAHKDLFNKLKDVFANIPKDALTGSGLEAAFQQDLTNLEHALASEGSEIFQVDPKVFEKSYNSFKQNYQTIKDRVEEKLKAEQAKEIKIVEDPMMDPEMAILTDDPEYVKEINAIQTKLDDKYGNAVREKTAAFNKAEKELKDSGDRLKKARTKKSKFDDSLKRANEKANAEASLFDQAKSNYETKQRLSEEKKTEYDTAKDHLLETDVYFNNKQAAESFDANNEELGSAKYNIDKNGDILFLQIRSPFNQYYARKDFAKKPKHGDSKEYTHMIDRLTDIIELNDNASIAEYKTAIEKLKSFAQTYVRVREGQFFKNKRNPMRQFRLSFAKGLISLCDDQLQNLDGTERTNELNPAVEKYLQRTKKVSVKRMTQKETEEAKASYNQSLDAKKKEAISTYKLSVEYKGKKKATERKSLREMRMEEDLLMRMDEQNDNVIIQDQFDKQRLHNSANNIILQENPEIQNQNIIQTQQKKTEKNYN